MSRAPSRYDDASQPPPMGAPVQHGQERLLPRPERGPGGVVADSDAAHCACRPGAAMYRRIALAAADLSLAAGGLLVVWALLRSYQDVQPALRRRPGHRRALGRWRAARRRHAHPRVRRPGDLAGAPAALAGDRGCRGHRVAHCWCRHGRGGGDHQPRPSTRSRARFRPPTSSRYAAPAATAVTALAHPGGEGEAGSPVTVGSPPAGRLGPVRKVGTADQASSVLSRVMLDGSVSPGA